MQGRTRTHAPSRSRSSRQGRSSSIRPASLARSARWLAWVAAAPQGRPEARPDANPDSRNNIERTGSGARVASPSVRAVPGFGLAIFGVVARRLPSASPPASARTHVTSSAIARVSRTSGDFGSLSRCTGRHEAPAAKQIHCRLPLGSRGSARISVSPGSVVRSAEPGGPPVRSAKSKRSVPRLGLCSVAGRPHADPIRAGAFCAAT